MDAVEDYDRLAEDVEGDDVGTVLFGPFGVGVFGVVGGDDSEVAEDWVSWRTGWEWEP